MFEKNKGGRWKTFNKDGNIVKGRYVAQMEIPKSPFEYFGNINYDLTQILPSGYSVGQTRDGLNKAWLGYVIGLIRHEEKNKVYYASVIQKLQRELVDAGVADKSELANFPKLKMYALGEKKDYAQYLYDERVNLEVDVDQESDATMHPDQEDPDMKRQKNWLKEVYNSDGFQRVQE